MTYLAAAALLGWLIYSWSVALCLTMVCGVISLFYAGALTGAAETKVRRCFSMLVLALTLVMIGIATERVTGGGGPKVCNRVEC